MAGYRRIKNIVASEDGEMSVIDVDHIRILIGYTQLKYTSTERHRKLDASSA